MLVVAKATIQTTFTMTTSASTVNATAFVKTATAAVVITQKQCLQ